MPVESVEQCISIPLIWTKTGMHDQLKPRQPYHAALEESCTCSELTVQVCTVINNTNDVILMERN